MGKQKREFSPPTRGAVQHEGGEQIPLTVYQGKPRKNVCILSTVHTGVGTFSGAKAKPESVMYYNNTKYGEDVPDQMARAYSVKGCTEDGQCLL